MKKRQQPEIRQTWESSRSPDLAARSRNNGNRTSPAAAGSRNAASKPGRRKATRRQKIQLAVTIVVGLLVLVLLTGFVFWRVVLSRINRG